MNHMAKLKSPLAGRNNGWRSGAARLISKPFDGDGENPKKIKRPFLRRPER